MKANEIETQMQIVHFSEKMQIFMVQNKKNQVLPKDFKPFRVLSEQRFKKFYKFITVACIIESQHNLITLKFLEKQFSLFSEKERENTIMDALIKDAIQLIN